MPKFAIITLAILVMVAALALMWPRIARADLLKEGDVAPQFDTQMVIRVATDSAPDATQSTEVKPVKLSDFLGRKLVLYFYPKDETPGCTKEACAFRDGYAKFKQAGVAVLGCSVDTEEAHKAFIQKYQLPFPLVLDPDRKIATAYGVANGIPILGLDKRVTYVIDEDGKILKVYPQVDPALNATQIIDALGPLSPAASSDEAPATTTPAVPPASR